MEGFLFEEAISFLMQNELNYMVTFDKIMYKRLTFYVILLVPLKKSHFYFQNYKMFNIFFFYRRCVSVKQFNILL